MLASSLALLAGCTEFTPMEDTQTPENTATSESTGTNPPEDYSLPDLRIFNNRDRTVIVTVTLVPEEQTKPSMELAVRVSPDDKVEWSDNPLMNDPGHVTATADDETGEIQQDERDWRGDTIEDNRGIVVFVEDDEIVVGERIA